MCRRWNLKFYFVFNFFSGSNKLEAYTVLKFQDESLGKDESIRWACLVLRFWLEEYWGVKFKGVKAFKVIFKFCDNINNHDESFGGRKIYFIVT